MPDPTQEQKKVLEESSHCVVVARPGSGKTFTLALKLTDIMRNLPDHKGIAAISYTNKASDELKRRCLATGVPRKASFFGTIDKFFITELLDFLPHVIGRQRPFDLQFVKIPKDQTSVFDELLNTRRTDFTPEELIEVGLQYEAGHLPLEIVAKLGVFVFDNSLACRRYLKALYSHIAIDEYQDSGFEQHELFLRLKGLGIIAIAVGDIDQSIYGFSKKSAEFLTALANDSSFKPYAITQNHRCHESIVFYSLKLINANIQATSPTDLRVYDKTILGSEAAVAAWLDSRFNQAMNKFGVERNSQIGVLFRSNRSGELIAQNLKTPHKLFASTAFDDDNSLWSVVFRQVLGVIFDPAANRYELVEEYLSFDLEQREVKACLRLLRELQHFGATTPDNLKAHIDKFIDIAKILYPRAENQKTIEILQSVLSNADFLASFMPAQPEQIQLMTLHKSKGLEFDIVFHLDLNQWILPSFNAIKGDSSELTQDLNLHYVGVTRAKKCVVLCTSTKRTKATGEVVDSERSAFLNWNGVENYRKHL